MDEPRDLIAHVRGVQAAKEHRARAIEQAGEIPMEERTTPILLKPRLTVVEHVYHQEGGGKSPVGSDCVSARFLRTDEQPYVRKTRIGETWTRLDTGWLASVSLIRVVNEATVFATYPSLREKTEAEAKVLEIGVEDETGVHSFARVRPGDSFRIDPVDSPSLRVRCRSGFAQVTIHAFPE